MERAQPCGSRTGAEGHARGEEWLGAWGEEGILVGSDGAGEGSRHDGPDGRAGATKDRPGAGLQDELADGDMRGEAHVEMGGMVVRMRVRILTVSQDGRCGGSDAGRPGQRTWSSGGENVGLVVGFRACGRRMAWIGSDSPIVS